MSMNLPNETLDKEEVEDELNRSSSNGEEQPWESMAKDWLSTIPEGKAVTPIDMEAWLQSNQPSLPHQLFSMPRPQLYERFTSIRNDLVPSPFQNPRIGASSRQSKMRTSILLKFFGGFTFCKSCGSLYKICQEKDGNQVDHYSQARFQRTDQWLPVYTWLESLETDEVIKSQDVIDWLTANKEVKDDLYSRHSRYHLMHYIKKCHLKILKRKEKKKGLPTIDRSNSLRVQKTVGTKLQVPLPSSNVNSLPTDSEMYMAKRNEAFRKYEILVEMEQQLATLFSKREDTRYLTQS